MAKQRTQLELNQDIISSLDVVLEYEALGVVFATDSPRASGMMSCYSIAKGGPDGDKKPSAVVNVNTGRYSDSTHPEDNLSLWDFAAHYSKSPSFADWKAARAYYAEKAGVKLGRATKKKSADETQQDILDQLHFLDWNDGTERLAMIWGRLHKKGISVEAIKANGGMVARWRCYFKRNEKGQQVGEKQLGKYTVVALPAFGPDDNFQSPRAWVIWNISGGMLEIYRGKDVPPEPVKMLAVGSTHGLMMGKWGLDRLVAARSAAGGEEVALVWKTGGPSCMLALFTSIPPELRDQHCVVTNASGETGDVSPEMAAVFGGQKLYICGDCDTAGVIGAAKWFRATAEVAAEVKMVRLPYEVTEKHGKDIRHYLTQEVVIDNVENNLQIAMDRFLAGTW